MGYGGLGARKGAAAVSDAGYRNVDAATAPDLTEAERFSLLAHRRFAVELRRHAAELLTLPDAADTLPGRVTWLTGAADVAQLLLEQAQGVERECAEIENGKQRV